MNLKRNKPKDIHEIDKKKSKKHNMSMAMQIIAIVMLLVCMILINVLEKQANYYTLADVNDFGAKEYFDGYIKTSELTDEDMADEYQKNYQETEESNGSYITKSAEWTDQTNGEALITIKAASNEEPKGTKALYVATLCYNHGLSQNIVVKNIQTLLQYYDEVDFIAINYNTANGILPTKTFDQTSSVSEITNYVSTSKNSGMSTPHAVMSIPPAIQKYLFGEYGNDSIINEDNLINDPTAIYVSCDTLLSSSYTWGTEYGTATYFKFIEEYYGDRYFSMSQYSKSSSSVTISNESGTAAMRNVLLGVLNPEYYGQEATAISGTRFTDSKYAADYDYSQTFDEANVTMVTETTVTDTISDKFTITSVEAADGTNSLTATIDGQSVSVTDTSYTSGDEITVKIYIKLKDESTLEGFEDTNSTKATLKNGDDYLEVESPKLALPKASLVVTKVWDDNSNQDGIRPEDITLKLYANGKELTDAEPSISKSEDTWTYTYTDLFRYQDGEEITYTVREVDIEDGYEASYGNTTYDEENNRYELTITNTHEPETTEVEVTKIWDDNNDQDGKRPDSIKITLQKTVNGVTEDVQTITLQSTGDTWEHTFINLPAYESGYKIVYTVTEESVTDYEASISGDAESGFTITNTHIPEEIDISVTKIWDDDDDSKGHRPTSVLVWLTGNGYKIEGYDVVLDEENEWSYTFEDMPRYTNSGQEIEWAVVEEEVEENDLEYYEDPVIEVTKVENLEEVPEGMEYNDLVVTVTNSYKDINPEMETELEKTGTATVTSSSQEVDYTIDYEAIIDNYIGGATVTIVDYLPYSLATDEEGNLVEGIDLDGGEYDSDRNTITWVEEIDHINTFTNVGDLVADEDETEEVVEDENIENSEEIEGNIEDNTEDSEEDLEVEENDITTYSENESELEGSEEELENVADSNEEAIIGEYDTEGKYHINIIKNITVVFADLDATQREMTNEVISNLYLEETDTEVDDEAEHTTELAVPGRVNATYVDIDTGEEIAEEEDYEGLVGEEYQTEQKDIEYYTFVEVEGDTEGLFTEDDKYITYYYQKKPFNLAVEKNISKIIIDSTEQTVTNGKLSKVEVPVSSASTANLEVTYTITVSNTGEIAGTADVVETIPDYFTVTSGTSSEWEEQSDGTLKAAVELDEGETKELTVVLKWSAGSSNFGTLTNTVSLENVDNPAGFDEQTVDDNTSEATLIVSVKTGLDKGMTVIGMVIAVLLITAGGIILRKKTLKG